MVDDFRVSPGILQEDAQLWRGWRDQLTGVKDGIPRPEPLAFSVLPGAQDVFVAYAKAVLALTSALEDGVEQFDGIAETLDWAAEQYRTAEEDNVAEIEAVAGR
ncbi:hypothetical protein [Microbacterium sp. 18062]|uniref:hypothetical protein n=1 Tax=Microbacterium sp. 18062 TaxID=2681410 RepID=UPI001356CD38|nr:hypothetical protein [Microbacterium sp. 18062]